MSKSMSLLCFSALLLMVILQVVFSLDCESCGKECKQICGTKRFRNCCYNYIKKRSSSETSGSGVQLELMMIDPETSRYYPYFKNVFVGDEDQPRLKIYPEEPDGEN